MLSRRVLHVLAETGFAEAQYQLGLHYCIVNNSAEAIHWLKLAASQNHQLALDLTKEIIERNLMDEKT